MNLGRLYPALLAAWLVLVQWRQAGPTTGRAFDLATSLAAALAFGVAASVLGRRITKDGDRAALVALVVVLFTALFSSFTVFASPALSLRIGESAVLWTALCGALVVGARHAPVSARTSRALSLAAIVLLVSQTVFLVGAGRTAAAPSRGAGGERSASRPDLYVLLLDKYSAKRWLRESYGLDNQPFEDSLRALGFYLPERARSNYPHTGLVIATLLDGRLIHQAVADEGAKWPAVFERIEDAMLWEFLRARGYRFAFFPSTFNATRENRNADITLSPPARATRTAPFHTWKAHAPFRALIALRCGWRGCETSEPGTATRFPYAIERAEALRWKLETLETLPDSTGPIVAFLHLLTPHEPYQFRADCEAYEPWWPLTDVDADTTARHAYRDQVECVNRLVLGTVRTLLARSTVPPVIIIQSDHGHARIARDAMRGLNIPLAELPASRIRERLDVFAAYYATDAAGIWYDSISPANVLPRLLNARFGAALPLNPDSSWWVDDFWHPLAVTPLRADQLRLSRGAPPSP